MFMRLLEIVDTASHIMDSRTMHRIDMGFFVQVFFLESRTSQQIPRGSYF